MGKKAGSITIDSPMPVYVRRGGHKGVAGSFEVELDPGFWLKVDVDKDGRIQGVLIP